jgi:hypothetical protein
MILGHPEQNRNLQIYTTGWQPRVRGSVASQPEVCIGDLAHLRDGE